MMKSSSVFLRSVVGHTDASQIARWLKDREVTRYLNEKPGTSEAIEKLLADTRLPDMTCFFSRNGRFFVIYADTRPVGFIRLIPQPMETEIVIVPFGEAHARAAVDAYLRFGKGRHRAGLNFGDCLTYAVARLAGEPLLCTGPEFRRTDLQIA
jgi:uncharacterized protein with PIN domain